MLIDLLNSSNFIMVNMDAIRIFGLNTAVYCAELLNIYKKAVIKKKLYNDDKYFKVDRKYMTKQTSLSVEDQIKCDKNLIKVNIIKVDENDPDIICFDVEVYASLLSSEDVKLLDKVSEKVKVANPKGTKATAKERIVIALKKSIECNTPEITTAIEGWIDSVTEQRALSKIQVKMFKDAIDDYCNGDLEKALSVISIATVHAYIDCQWAINLYERGNKPQSVGAFNSTPVKGIRITEQKRTVSLGEEQF